MKVDKEKVEEVMGYVNEVRHSLEPGRTRGLLAAAYCVLEMIYKEATDSDPGDECECECEGCRAKDAEDELAEAFPPEPPSVNDKNDGITVIGECRIIGGGGNFPDCIGTFQPSDYEMRLKAWESVQGFWFPDESEFDEAFTAAKKLYNFLSGQNEDVK